MRNYILPRTGIVLHCQVEASAAQLLKASASWTGGLEVRPQSQPAPTVSFTLEYCVYNQDQRDACRLNVMSGLKRVFKRSGGEVSKYVTAYVYIRCTMSKQPACMARLLIPCNRFINSLILAIILSIFLLTNKNFEPLYKLLMLEEAKQNKTLKSYIHVQAKTKVKHCQSSGQVALTAQRQFFFFRRVGLGFSKEFCQQARCRQCHLILKLQQCPKLKLHFPAELPLTNVGLEMCRRGHPTDSGCTSTSFPAPVESSGFCQLSIIFE